MLSHPGKIVSARLARGFSLIELLAVIGVIGVMMALTTSGLRGWGSANKLRSAVDIVSNMGMIARQNSLAKNAMTALVVMNQGAGDSDAFRAVALWELTPRSDAATPPAWKQLTPWKRLPQGTVIDPSSSFLTPSTDQPDPTYRFPSSLTIAGQAVSNPAYQIFMPNGRLLNSAAVPVSIQLVEGVVENSEVIQTGVKDGGKTANAYDVVFLAATGKAKVRQSQP